MEPMTRKALLCAGTHMIWGLRMDGADDRIRTGDLRFTKALLYQLSYIGAKFSTPSFYNQSLSL